MTIFQEKLLTRAYCDEAGDKAVPNVLSPKDLVFIPDLSLTVYEKTNILVSDLVQHKTRLYSYRRWLDA